MIGVSCCLNALTRKKVVVISPVRNVHGSPFELENKFELGSTFALELSCEIESTLF